MKVFSVVIFFIFSSVSFGQQKQVCFSFDDLPIVNYGITDSIYQKDLFNKIIFSLKKNKIPAIGFVNEKKLHDNENIIQYQVDLLRNWITNGLELGNHTFSHPDYNSVSFSDYTEDIIKGETIVKRILKEQNKQLKYFRHPFLHVGNTKAKADSLNDFLSKRNYLIAPVTIDNEDYLFALAYKRTKQKNDTALMHQIGHDYIDYMEQKLKYYEMQSNKLFGRNINQILLLHTSSLNSDYLDSLIRLY
jgi:peptidoglycan/xylan/chitin deacetylase (PgdA/CDA1 family)